MKDYGLVSIITPSYNSAEFIGTTIESIQNQTYQNWELLVVDDASSDNSITIIRRYAATDSRIKLFSIKDNSGAGVARNVAIKAAKGRYIAFCDSDDIWLPEKLERQLEMMDLTGSNACHSSYYVSDNIGTLTGTVRCRSHESYRSILKDDKIGCLTFIYNAEKLGKIFLPLHRRRQDWGMKLLALKKCTGSYGVSTPLAIYKKRSGSLSQNKFQLIKYNIAIYTDVIGWSKCRAYAYFCTLFIPNYLYKKIRINIYNRIHPINVPPVRVGRGSA